MAQRLIIDFPEIMDVRAALFKAAQIAQNDIMYNNGGGQAWEDGVCANIKNDLCTTDKKITIKYINKLNKLLK